MPFEEEAFGFFVGITLNQNIVLIVFIYCGKLGTLWIGLLIDYWRILSNFLNYIYFEKVLFAFLDFLVDFVNHSLVRFAILL